MDLSTVAPSHQRSLRAERLVGASGHLLIASAASLPPPFAGPWVHHRQRKARTESARRRHHGPPADSSHWLPCAPSLQTEIMPVAPLAVGQTIKFANPLSDDKRDERFTVVELRGDRVLVEFICDMRIKPQSVYLASDLEPIDQA